MSDKNTVSEIERDMAALVNVRLDDDAQQWVRVDENGVLDIPISVVRQLSDWLKRYDMRPKSQKVSAFALKGTVR